MNAHQDHSPRAPTLETLAAGLKSIEDRVTEAVAKNLPSVHPDGPIKFARDVLGKTVAPHKALAKLERHVLGHLVDLLARSGDPSHNQLLFDLGYLGDKLSQLVTGWHCKGHGALTGAVIRERSLMVVDPSSANSRWFASRFPKFFENSAQFVASMENELGEIYQRGPLPAKDALPISLAFARAAAIAITREPPEFEVAKGLASLAKSLQPSKGTIPPTLPGDELIFPIDPKGPSLERLYGRAAADLRHLLFLVPEIPSSAEDLSAKMVFCGMLRRAFQALSEHLTAPLEGANPFTYDDRQVLAHLFLAPREYFGAIPDLDTAPVQQAFKAIAEKLSLPGDYSYFHFAAFLSRPNVGVLHPVLTWAKASFPKSH